MIALLDDEFVGSPHVRAWFCGLKVMGRLNCQHFRHDALMLEIAGLLDWDHLHAIRIVGWSSRALVVTSQSHSLVVGIS